MEQSIEKIRVPILISLTLSLIGVVVVAIICLQWSSGKHCEEELRAKSQGLGLLLADYVAEDAKLMTTVLESIKEDENLQKAWQAEKRDELYRHARPILNTLKGRHSITQLYFHQADKINFLRVHDASQFGDVVDRFSLAQAVDQQQPAQGLELGVFGILTVRVVHPWYINGVLSGYIELGKDLLAVIPQLKEALGVELFVFVDKKFLDKQRWQQGRTMLGRSADWDQFTGVVLLGQTLDTLPRELKNVLGQQQIATEGLQFAGSRAGARYGGSAVGLSSSRGQRLGTIVVLADFSKHKALLGKLTAMQAVVLVAMIVVLFLAYGKYLGNVEYRISRKNRELLDKIAEKKQAELARKASEEQYKDLFENAYDLIQIIAPDGTILFVNRSWRHTFGYGQPELKDLKIFDLIDADCEHECETLFGRVLVEGQVSDIKTVFVAKDGRKINLEGSANAKYEDGKPVSIRCIFRNVTKQKELEEKLFQAQKMEAVGTLAGGIAHDFNNILAAIMGYNEMARQDTPQDNPVRQMLEHVAKGAERARDLVQQILTFSRRGGQPKVPMLLQPVIQEVLKLLRASMPATITISSNIGADCGLVLADPTMIHQLVMNLGTNSYHAMRDSGGTLSLTLSSVTVGPQLAESVVGLHEGPYVQLTVSDTGHGIDQATLKRIFEPYYTTKVKGEGTGLGLAVVHGIVSDLGGGMTVDSEVGEGTTFQVFLPQTTTAVGGEEVAEVAVPQGQGRILFVDDEEDITTMASLMLTRLGYQVTTFNSSRQALQAFEQNPEAFELIITDQTMPELTGLDLAKAIMAIRPGMPILLISGYSEQVDAESCRAMGLSGYQRKPFKEYEIGQEIQTIMSRARQGGM